MDLTGLASGKNGTRHINKMIPSEGTPVNGVASQGLLTIAEPVTNGDTMTIGATVYTFVTGATTAAGEIGIGASEAATKLAIPLAINGGDTFNTANASASVPAAFTGDGIVITALVGGVAGDLIATTETFTHNDNILDAVTLGTETAGVDGTVGVSGECLMDASYLYYCVAVNTIADANWVRASVASF